MGQTKSQNISPAKKYQSQEDNYLVSESFPMEIPDDLLIDVLSYVPAKDLVRNCRLVCKLWKTIIDEQSVWKQMCERERRSVPSVRELDAIPVDYYRDIYFYDTYGRNLVQNPCGEGAMEKWSILANYGDGFRVENPPGGCEPVPSEVGIQSCFATSFDVCRKVQLIDLHSEGAHPEILRLKTTKITVGEWHAARFDCAAEYELLVVLLDNSFSRDELSSMEETHLPPSVMKDHRSAIDSFEFKFIEEQWIGKEWHKVSHTFENLTDVRYVFFAHSGKDRQFWAGHYGAKMTGAYVKVLAS